MKKTALITGISGQDGAYLAEFLLNKNYKIIGTDRRSARSVNWRLRRLNIENKIQVMKSSAAVDVEYSGQYLFTHHEQDRWETYADKNRITLGKDKLGHWKIMSGL